MTALRRRSRDALANGRTPARNGLMPGRDSVVDVSKQLLDHGLTSTERSLPIEIAGGV